MNEKVPTWERWIIRVLAAVAGYFLVQTHADVREVKGSLTTIHTQTQVLEVRLDEMEKRLIKLENTCAYGLTK
jgi:hypothetical protein